MAKHPSSITSLPPSPDEDRRRRMLKYSLTMGIRMVCIILCLFVRDWWLVVCATGAVVLPYIAVVLANAVDSRTAVVLRPGAILPVSRPPEVSPDANGTGSDDPGRDDPGRDAGTDDSGTKEGGTR